MAGAVPEGTTTSITVATDPLNGTIFVVSVGSSGLVLAMSASPCKSSSTAPSGPITSMRVSVTGLAKTLLNIRSYSMWSMPSLPATIIGVLNAFTNSAVVVLAGTIVASGVASWARLPLAKTAESNNATSRYRGMRLGISISFDTTRPIDDGSVMRLEGDDARADCIPNDRASHAVCMQVPKQGVVPERLTPRPATPYASS